ncbi:zinc-binding alcohol dehydrogenase family protein [Halioxenophilus aromaticivorans]|uniref:Zinc-type alcohol dehydrogenase-like protein n=1 Tax=Halioxenophilus aromaticivorans TaxID=1306992 RepID=A0AAV3U187_9ALTE
MKAVGYQDTSERAVEGCLQDIDIAKPSPGAKDLLVAIQAISVNPIDTKIRRRAAADAGQYKILGWDAVGVVEAVGAEVNRFKPGDRVFYAGDAARPGVNAEYNLVDERIVGKAPLQLSNAEAAAMPLTSVTAWEILFDRLQINVGKSASQQRLLIIGGAGGVGSIMTQLARKLTGIEVIATASRESTQAWVKKMGAHHVIDHSKPLSEELSELGIDGVDYVASLTHTHEHVSEIQKVLKPQGKLALIDDPDVFDIKIFKDKSISIHWELMYTRIKYNTPDMAAQGQILSEVAYLLDEGVLQTTQTEHFGTINAKNLTLAHRAIETNKTLGKIVLEGF